MSAQDFIDKLTRACESGRITIALVETAQTAPWSDLREWAESLGEVADQLEDFLGEMDAWDAAEDREERADARERALEAAESFVDAWNNSMLNLTWLADHETSNE